MRIWSTLLIAAPVAAGLLAAPAAHADWRDHRGWHGERHGDQGLAAPRPRQRRAAAAAVLGLGAAAILGGVIRLAAGPAPPPYYAPPPPVVYAPPPGYYAPDTRGLLLSVGLLLPV